MPRALKKRREGPEADDPEPGHSHGQQAIPRREDACVPKTLDPPGISLILGGARSGKSRYAESLACARAPRRCYLATAEAGDKEMAERIRQHQARRDKSWVTVEEPLDAPGALARESGGDSVVLVDCLTLWLANLIAAGRDVASESARLCAVLRNAKGPIILVSNEVGQGIVPENALARRFRDEAGRLHQAVAAEAGEVVLMVAGLPLTLKSAKQEEISV